MIGTLAVGERAKAQQAAASLERIEAGDADAPGERGTEPSREFRRVCVNTAAFVFAVKAHDDSRVASAAFTTEQSEDVEDRDPRASRLTGTPPGLSEGRIGPPR